MRVTLDRSCDAAYIYLVDDIPPGGVARTLPLLGITDGWHDITLDFDAAGHLIGIEVMAASIRLPNELLSLAEIISPPGAKSIYEE